MGERRGKGINLYFLHLDKWDLNFTYRKGDFHKFCLSLTKIINEVVPWDVLRTIGKFVNQFPVARSSHVFPAYCMVYQSINHRKMWSI